MTVEYDSLAKLIDACRTLDEHHIGWAAASVLVDNPFGPDHVAYRLYASEYVPA